MKIYCISAGSDSTAVTEWRPNIHPTIHYLIIVVMMIIMVMMIIVVMMIVVMMMIMAIMAGAPYARVTR